MFFTPRHAREVTRDVHSCLVRVTSPAISIPRLPLCLWLCPQVDIERPSVCSCLDGASRESFPDWAREPAWALNMNCRAFQSAAPALVLQGVLSNLASTRLDTRIHIMGSHTSSPDLCWLCLIRQK